MPYLNYHYIKTWIVYTQSYFLYLKTSRVTCCFAIATTVFSYIRTLWIPIPQKMPKASTKFSSFFVNGRSSNLLTSWKTPKTRLCFPVYLIGMQRIVLWRKLLPLSTLWNRIFEKSQYDHYLVSILGHFDDGRFIDRWFFDTKSRIKFLFRICKYFMFEFLI